MTKYIPKIQKSVITFPQIRVLLAVIIMSITLGVMLRMMTQTQTTITRAQGISTKYNNFGLIPPYIRLASEDKIYSGGQKVPIGIYINSAGIPTSEAVLVINYNPDLLTVSPGDISSSGVYPVINIEKADPGKIVMSLFNPTGLGYKSVVLSQDTLVATMQFSVAGNNSSATAVTIQTQGEQDETSHLFQERVGNETILEDILKSVEIVNLSINN
jgi:hypothetical protein